MTTVKDILDKFNSILRYPDVIENINIGEYTFDEGHTDNTGYVLEFTSNSNPDVWLRINDDRRAVTLIKKVDDETVSVTSWNTHGKFTKNFPIDSFKPYSSDRRKPIPTVK